MSEGMYIEKRCPKCGCSVFEWEHQPCSDHPELIETVHECEVCDWSEVV